ncbi:MAG: nicotinamide-nucleotide amidohydrolase family protein [Lachnospiraceae bacterium]|nr:nicotinamide-nucleotide amidohydrolase family protein [Lachnospiraceae bacterium]
MGKDKSEEKEEFIEIEEKDVNEYTQLLKLCGIPIGEVKKNIKDLIKEGGDNPVITLLEEKGEVYIRVSAEKEGEKSAKKIAKPVIKELKSRFSEKIYTTDENTTLEETVVELLKNNKLTVTTAESCTGGMIAARLVDIPGVSEVFKEGFITYSNKSKRLRLGVKKGTLSGKGAVSEQTVKEMLKGAIKSSKADCALAVSGVAGPDGGTEEKPVGTVYIGCYVGGKATVIEKHFEGDRKYVRECTVTESLALLRICLLKYYSEKNFG